MSKKGPTGKNHRVRIISLDDAKAISKHVDAATANLFQSAQAYATQSKAIIGHLTEIAKNHNSKTRKLNADIFSAENQLFIQENIETLVTMLSVSYLQRPIPYDNIDSSNQDKAETILLEGYERANVWEIILNNLLPYCSESKPDLKTKVTDHLIEELINSSSVLFKRFLNDKLSSKNYYFIYRLFIEKITWFETYVDEFQNHLLLDLTAQQKTNNLTNLLLFYKFALTILHCFGDADRAFALQQKGSLLINELIPLCNKKNNLSATNLLQMKMDFSLAPSVAATAIDKNLLPLFLALDRFYTTIWLNDTPPSQLDCDESSFIGRCAAALNKIKDEKESIADNVDTFLKCLTELKSISKEKRTPPMRTHAFSLIIGMAGLLKKQNFAEKGFTGKTITAMVKLIADDLSKEMQQLTVSPMDDLIQGIRNLSLEQAEKAVQTQQNAHTVAMASAKLSAEKQLAEEKKKLEDEHQRQLKALCQKHDQEKRKLAMDLAEENEKKLTDLKAKNKSRLEQTKAKLDKQIEQMRKASDNQFKQEKEVLDKNHGQALAQLQKDQDVALLKLKADFKAKLEAVRSRQQCLYDELIAANKKAHSELVENQSAILAKREAAFKEKLIKQKEAHEASLADLKNQQEAVLREWDAKYEVIIKQLASEQAKQFEQEKQRLAQAESEAQARVISSEKKVKKSAIEGKKPIGTFEVSTETRYLLDDLSAAGIEFYFIGGYMRSQLGLPSLPDGDIDIIINADPDELPPRFRSFCQQASPVRNHLKLGRYDLRCEKWDNLETLLLTRDLTINTFIGTLDGHIYDLLGVEKDIHSKYLNMIGNLKERKDLPNVYPNVVSLRERFADDPSLILRMFRFSNQLSKFIHPNDLKIITQMADKITCMPFGIYLKNIYNLFVSPFAIANFNLISSLNCLNALVPGIPADYYQHLNVIDTDLLSFWQYKLQMYCIDPHCNYYHVLALFLMLPFSLQPPSQSDTRLQTCINAFLKGYQGEFLEGEKQKLTKTIQTIFLDPPPSQQTPTHVGLWSEFLHFKQQRAFVPYYQHTQQHQHRKKEQPHPSSSSKKLNTYKK